MGSSPLWNTGTIRPESSWENSEVLMIDELSIVETNEVIHTVETDMVKLVVEIKCFGMSFDKFDKEIGSPDRLQPKQADLSCVHALNKPHFHEIHVVPSKHEADQKATKTIRTHPLVDQSKLPIRLTKVNCQFGCQRKTANSVDQSKLQFGYIGKLLIQLNWEAANPVKSEKLRIWLNLEAANPVKAEKLSNSVNWEALRRFETKSIRIPVYL
ncbi:hypothetical protein Tco_0841178 [Tanacetum coccineum]|uniref:Uncharacterized protein n=1 Tax=Tanacetum coccineum TaxID=301880 RepID=A0ABQ5AWQ0_9ASTR